MTASERILSFPEYEITLTDYLKAETGLHAINPDAIFRLGQMMAARYPSVLANVHKNLPEITEQPESLDKRCKLTAELASEMRHAYETENPKPSMRQLAERFGLKSSSQVCKILHNHSWKL